MENPVNPGSIFMLVREVSITNRFRALFPLQLPFDILVHTVSFDISVDIGTDDFYVITVSLTETRFRAPLEISHIGVLNSHEFDADPVDRDTVQSGNRGQYLNIRSK